MLSKKMNVFWLAVVMIFMLMPVAVFAGGEKEEPATKGEPAATAPEKEPEATVTL